MPVARFQAAAATTPGRVYTMGGFVEGGSTPIDSMVSIDTATGQWRTETPMPTPRALLSAVYVPGGKIYAMGGEAHKTRSIRSSLLSSLATRSLVCFAQNSSLPRGFSLVGYTVVLSVNA